MYSLLFSPQGRSHSRSSSFSQEVETALESFDFLNCSDMDDEEEEERVLDQEAEQSENYSERSFSFSSFHRQTSPLCAQFSWG